MWLEAQHRSLPVAGGADAPIREPTETLVTLVVSSQTLPSEIQEKTIRLLARLLRGHVDGVVAAELTREAHDE